MSVRPDGPSSFMSAALARGRLGMGGVAFFALAGAAPLTVAAGVIPTAYAVTGLTSIAAAFLGVGLVLYVFADGYVAMSRHIPNAGAFYAFIARGLGRPAGVSAAMVSLSAYNALQVGLYGALGPGAASFAAEYLHLDIPWWAPTLAVWLLVTILGLARVDVNRDTLGVLLIAEILVLAALIGWGLTHPDGGHISFSALSPAHLLKTQVGAALAVAVLGFVGFEQTSVYAEEARDPRRTVPRATYLTLSLISCGYAGAAWAIDVHHGARVVADAIQQGPGLLFGLGPRLLGFAANLLFLTSLFAAALVFHNAVMRYEFALAREGVLPAKLGRTGHDSVPRAASAVQSLIGLASILIFAITGASPETVMHVLFFAVGTFGGFGILLLLTATSISVIVFFARDRRGEPVWRTTLAPALAAGLLLIVVVLCVINFGTLLDVAPGSLAARLVPASWGAAIISGFVVALRIRSRHPEAYQAIGHGADAAVAALPQATASPAATRGATQ